MGFIHTSQISSARSPIAASEFVPPPQSLVQSAVKDLRKLLLDNCCYPQGIITYHINDVLNRHKNKSDNAVPTVPQKDIIILLRYLGFHRNQITKRLKSCVYNF